MEIVELFELGTIDLLGKPLLTCAVERFLGLWNVRRDKINSVYRHKVFDFVCERAVIIQISNQ